ncbi:MAG: aspartate carbamoyltransferase catalytic subunit [Gammaproteobacteria bacterium]|nr:aspartate carbamoyltransferase catalytic subunit [Gammaproteobacteria bacterium]MCP4091588.1 aspartate carbamoyltransferase catalytic subunit [Gammaproteobacteria bacterium]MCP4276084.1 aspartate carbamoyltransferase catalytic subunit [Gammaproteobacteria bacterium]MCP4832576.1 aspartate carbamoyltransferase catalytic subunit [Gammaproteobacteria bacterium]MCP4929654.1 aspartate carbamoyltransferase catalytic subunit [Gammaproteobacteria bacterium]
MSTPNKFSAQLTEDGKLRHLLRLEGLSREFITHLLDRAESYQRPAGDTPARDTILQGHTVANLFFEPSTRTRASFELAAKRLSADVLNLDVNMSSRIKGESLLDTIYTLQAMQVDIFVVRDASAGIPDFISSNVQSQVSVLNAGESDVAHPTQGLLDLLTIRQNKQTLDGLTVTIIGDIAHSRVARSVSRGLTIMGDNEIRLVAPQGLTPDMGNYPGAQFTHDINAAIEGADVVMALRIQRERIKEKSSLMTNHEYLQYFGLTEERIALAKPDAIIMHPGPMNRDVEIAGAVADGPQSVITQQVRNGLAIRMAVLAAVMESR